MAQGPGKKLINILIASLVLTGCATTSQIGKHAGDALLNANDLKNAHVGISVYDVHAKKSIYSYQGNKLFVPASNVKLLSTYAALKYLGDRLVAFSYFEDDTALFIIPSGDPTFLHKDYLQQPGVSFLQESQKKIYISNKNWKDEGLGFGWSWDDYNDDYMAERSPMPVYGNVVRWVQERDTNTLDIQNSVSFYSVPEVNWKVRFNPEGGRSFGVLRSRDDNFFLITEGKEVSKSIEVPFLTEGLTSTLELLPDTLGKEVYLKEGTLPTANVRKVMSQPLDSMLRPMMHRSDNFFAEQTLLMVSNQLLGYMSDSKIIDTLLKKDLSLLPQKPKWVDGSGLSRYNQISPDDFVWLLNDMQERFGIERMKRILPTGGQGTLLNYYKADSGYVFAKTGSLSGQIAISGYLYTLKNRLFAFSVLVNNHNGSASAIRREVERFIHEIRSKY